MPRCEAVTVAYGPKVVLDRLTITLPDTGVTALQGPSGCGKSTLLRLLAGLITPQSGAVTGWEGVRPVLLFQENRLFPWRTVEQHLTDVLPKGERSRAAELLELVGLAAEAKSYPGDLSGGMARRLAMARTLAAEGDFLLLDEPFAGVDGALAADMMAGVRRLGRPALFCAHEGASLRLADRVLPVEGLPLRFL